MKAIITSILLLIGILNVSAQLNPYYNGISTSATGQVLKDELSTLITTTHTTQLSYTPGIWDLLHQSDLDLVDPANVLLIYGYDDTDASSVNDRTRSVNLQQTGASNVGVWNREHVFAKSLGTPDLGTSGPGADGHHLRAADGQMNSTRNNRLFSYGSGNATTVGVNYFYPGDEWKGDVARMIMYMYLRYPTQCIPTNVGEPTITTSTFDQMVDIFILWNDQDSVSDFERQRNEVIYAAQGNRNPFIDNQNFATRIWGTVSTLGFEPAKLEEIELYPNPTNGSFTLNIPFASKWTYTITDQLGRQLRSGATVSTIDVADLAEGRYFVTVCAEQQAFTTSIVKK